MKCMITPVLGNSNVIESHDAISVALTTFEGDMQILEGHESFEGTLKAGSSISLNGEVVVKNVAGGFFSIKNDTVKVLYRLKST